MAPPDFAEAKEGLVPTIWEDLNESIRDSEFLRLFGKYIQL